MHQSGFVRLSSRTSHALASSALLPHISGDGRSCTHTAGRPGCPKSKQRLSGVSWMHRTPEGFPCGIPGIGEVIDGAMQHAPHPARHSIYGRLATSSCDRFPPRRERVNFNCSSSIVPFHSTSTSPFFFDFCMVLKEKLFPAIFPSVISIGCAFLPPAATLPISLSPSLLKSNTTVTVSLPRLFLPGLFVSAIHLPSTPAHSEIVASNVRAIVDNSLFMRFKLLTVQTQPCTRKFL